MRDSLSRRQVLGGLGLLLLAGCPRPRRAAGAADARPLLAPTPAVDDGDDDVPPAAVCAATADNIEGPFWKAGAPHRADLATDRDAGVAAQERSDAGHWYGGSGFAVAGERLVLTGVVRTTGCAPLAGAELDLWHADARGAYDNDGFRFRGKLVTGADGRWLVSTIVPGRYLNGRRYRPAHVHAKLRAPGHRDLTTQLYFAGDPYNDGDPFIVPSLIMAHQVERGARRAGFDFVLEPA